MGIKPSEVLAIGFSDNFYDILKSNTQAVKQEYSLLLLNEGFSLPYIIGRTKVLVCPSKVAIRYPIYCDTVITCGMGAGCTLSFSAVGESTAMLSVSRTVGNTLPCDIRVDLKSGLSLYENLVLQACRLVGYN